MEREKISSELINELEYFRVLSYYGLNDSSSSSCVGNLIPKVTY
jgi:hypothetical protein